MKKFSAFKLTTILAVVLINVLAAILISTFPTNYPEAVALVTLVVNLAFVLVYMGTVYGTPVDTWECQRKLMQISAQNLPQLPTITNGTILYTALLAEELAETMRGLYTVLDSKLAQRVTSENETRCWVNIMETLNETATSLEQGSSIFKAMNPHVVAGFTLTFEDALPLLDGTTDIAVVNCGFALATGLPGNEGYDEVAGSNFSKANPDTGVIDKEPSGKWIKGKNFYLPDLRKVLEQQYSDYLALRNIARPDTIATL